MGGGLRRSLKRIGATRERVEYDERVLGGSEFVSQLRNRDLFVNSVNWLIGDIEAIAIRPRLSRASTFELSDSEFRNLRSLSLFVIPQLIAVLGVFTWWSRRNPAR